MIHIKELGAELSANTQAKPDNKGIQVEYPPFKATARSPSVSTIAVRLGEALMAEAAAPESIIHYVARTQESVIIDDASAENAFYTGTYIRQHHARSILCLVCRREKLTNAWLVRFSG